MVSALHHRGPDDSGFDRYVTTERECWLGSTRLSIIDLSAAGHMPMADTESDNRIVYNGEVYNFPELRESLSRAGARFSSHTDTECALKLYGREGPRSVERLRGMFAFAIWDASREELFLVRDRAGKKPLYYCVPRPGVFLFASEVRCLLASGLVEPRLDPRGVESYLANGFTISPVTIIRDVRSLLPGRWMRVSADGRILEESCYWTPPRPEPLDHRRLADSMEEVRHLFQESVRLRLVSDVPLSVFLSGGMDSSAVLGCLGPSGEDLRTFSVSFPEREYDESAHSRRVAAHWKTKHTEVPIDGDRFFRWLPDALASMDQPTFDGVNTYCVSRAARESGSKVALSGIGADELFGGYPFFKGVPLLTSVASLVPWVPAAMRSLVHGIGSGDGAMTRLSYAWKVLDLLEPGAARGAPRADYRVGAYQAAQILFPSWARRRLHSRAFASARNGTGSAVTFGIPEEFLRLLRSDIEGVDRTAGSSLLTWRLFLGERCLRDTDSMSMGVSLEVRAPFTDHLLVEALLRLPGHLRCAGAPDKPFERKLLDPFLKDAWEPRGKQGFVMPFQRWLSSPKGRDVMIEALEDREALGAVGLDAGAAESVWRAHCEKPSAVPWSRVWAIFILVHWSRRWKTTL